MEVAIVKYNAGNIQSVVYALERLGIHPTLTDEAEELHKADKVIFPGVGEANSAMNSLRSKGLDKVIPLLRQPVLGICIGQQLLCKYSEENDTPCLGVFDLKVKQFPKKGLKVPQIGWNNITELKTLLFEGIEEGAYVYFVHSFYTELAENTIARTEYGTPFSAALQKGNFYATQFHPEKSGRIGAKILQNFLEKA